MRHLASLFLDFPVAETDFEQQVFAFCQAWRAGQTEFTFHTSGSTGEPKPIVIKSHWYEHTCIIYFATAFFSFSIVYLAHFFGFF